MCGFRDLNIDLYFAKIAATHTYTHKHKPPPKQYPTVKTVIPIKPTTN
jgi:hypothetical protein